MLVICDEVDHDIDHTFIETDTKGKKSNSSSNLVPLKDEKNCQQDSMMSSEQYKLPLVWIDLEMTGKYVIGSW